MEDQQWIMVEINDNEGWVAIEKKNNESDWQKKISESLNSPLCGSLSNARDSYVDGRRKLHNVGTCSSDVSTLEQLIKKLIDKSRAFTCNMSVIWLTPLNLLIWKHPLKLGWKWPEIYVILNKLIMHDLLGQYIL